MPLLQRLVAKGGKTPVVKTTKNEHQSIGYPLETKPHAAGTPIYDSTATIHGKCHTCGFVPSQPVRKH